MLTFSMRSSKVHQFSFCTRAGLVLRQPFRSLHPTLHLLESQSTNEFTGQKASIGRYVSTDGINKFAFEITLSKLRLCEPQLSNLKIIVVVFGHNMIEASAALREIFTRVNNDVCDCFTATVWSLVRQHVVLIGWLWNPDFCRCRVANGNQKYWLLRKLDTKAGENSNFFLFRRKVFISGESLCKINGFAESQRLR